MGNELQCCAEMDQRYLQKQLQFYQWRADYKRNQFIPRVTFKKKHQLQHEELYTKFVEESTNNYVDPRRFEAKSSLTPTLKDKDVIVFQSYVCILEDIQGLLNIEESLYILNGLVGGFRQIKKVYEEFMVSSSCCFITNNGQVRAWINYNSKLNSIDKNPKEQTYLADQNAKIINKIIEIVIKSSEKSYEMLTFEVYLRQSLQKNIKGSDWFHFVLEITQTYRALHRINKISNMIQCLRRIKHPTSYKMIKQSQNHDKSLKKASFIEYIMPSTPSQMNYKRTNQVFSSMHSYQQLDSPSNHHLRTNYLAPHSSNLFLKLQTQPTLVSKSIKGSFIQRSAFHHRHSKKNLKDNQHHLLKQQHNLSIQQIFEKNTYPINDVQQFSLNANKIYEKQAQQKLTIKEFAGKGQVVLRHNTSLSDYMLSDSRYQAQYLSNKQWAVKRDIEQIQGIKPINHVHFKIFSQTNMNNHVNEPATACPKPWLNSKRTISKLIDENLYKNNVLISEGSASSYNKSQPAYSGILWNMGRDISHEVIQSK